MMNKENKGLRRRVIERTLSGMRKRKRKVGYIEMIKKEGCVNSDSDSESIFTEDFLQKSVEEIRKSKVSSLFYSQEYKKFELEKWKEKIIRN